MRENRKKRQLSRNECIKIDEHQKGFNNGEPELVLDDKREPLLLLTHRVVTRSPPRFFLFPVHKASVGTGASPGRCVTDHFFLFCAATVWVLYKRLLCSYGDGEFASSCFRPRQPAMPFLAFW